MDPVRHPGVQADNARGVQVGDANTQINQFLPVVAAEWPVRVGRPPLPADSFKDREDAQSALRADPSDREQTTVTHVLVGDGGTGKTQVAAAAFAKVCAGGVDLALWVTAASRAAVLVAYAKAYTATHPGAGGTEVEHDAEAFLTWLAGTDRSWIVVLDDVADPADLHRLWPTGSAGRLLVTTRRRDASIVARGRVIEVGVFAPEESAAYLRAKLGGGIARGDALVEAEDLATDLGHLPLALAQAASVIVDDGMTCAHYRAALADRTRTLQDLFPSDPGASGDEYDRTLAGTWSLAAERADALAPRGLAGPVLALAAVLDPNGSPESLFSAPSMQAYLAAAARATGFPGTRGRSTSDIRRALRNLHRLSLISHNPADEIRSVRMHALAQRSALEALGPQARGDLTRVVADALIESWPEVERDRTYAGALRSNAMAVIRREPTGLWEPTAHALLFRVGRSRGEAGLVSDAVAYFEALLADCRRRLGAEHVATLISRRELAVWTGESGDARTASRTLDQLGDEGSAILGPRHPETLLTRSAQIVWRGESGDFAGAADRGERLVQDLTEAFGPEHRETMDARASVAFWHGHAGDPDTALAETTNLLADYLRYLGPDHARVLSARHNLAHWRGVAGDPEAAVAETEALLVDDLRVLGPDHFDTLDTRRNLGFWRGRAGDLSGASSALDGVLTDMLRVLGPEHPHTMHARNDLANCLAELGDVSTAVAMLRQLLADRVRLLGPRHPHTLVTEHDLAVRRGLLEGPAAAVAQLQWLVSERTRILGQDHPYTIKCASSLAVWRGRSQSAE